MKPRDIIADALAENPTCEHDATTRQLYAQADEILRTLRDDYATTINGQRVIVLPDQDGEP